MPAMSYYPSEKAPRSDWVYPPEHTYTSRDGAPASSSSQYQAPPPEGNPGYYPPPPDYGYAMNHPANESKTQTVLAPPSNSDGYSVSDAGPSSSAASQDASQMSLGSFFGNKGNPPMWNRQPPQGLPYNGFPPMRLISNGHELNKGFPELPPPCQLNPHPFATHDITEEDWKRFLADVKKAGSLSPGQRIKSNVIPMVTGMSLITGFMATMAIEKRMKYRNRGAAGDLVDHWNHYFFGPRRMEVTLCQASQRLSGKVGPSPFGEEGLRRRDSSSSSEEDNRRGERHARRAERRARRRAEKAERKGWRARGDDKEPYELVVRSV